MMQTAGELRHLGLCFTEICGQAPVGLVAYWKHVMHCPAQPSQRPSVLGWGYSHRVPFISVAVLNP